MRILLCVLLFISATFAQAVQLHSDNYLVVENATGKVLFSKNSNKVTSIASITKLFTAIVTLESNQNLQDVITIEKADVDTLKHTYSRLAVGTKLTKEMALLLMLMSSENRAASALLRNYPKGKGLDAIKDLIRQMGLKDTVIVDANGLNPLNRSTGEDLLKVVNFASKFDKIKRFSTTKSFKFSKNTFLNSNPIIRTNSRNNLILSKTGFINESMFGVVVKTKLKNKTYTFILLRSPTKNGRFQDINTLQKKILSKR